MLAWMNTFTGKSIWRIRHTDEMRSILEVVLNSYAKLYDARVKRSKSRSCLHDKAFELGTRQTWESSDLRSKSADFECLQNCGSCFAAEQFVGISWGQNTFGPWHHHKMAGASPAGSIRESAGDFSVWESSKADIRNPSLQLCWQGLASLLAHERSRFAICQWELSTPTDISIPPSPAA